MTMVGPNHLTKRRVGPVASWLPWRGPVRCEVMPFVVVQDHQTGPPHHHHRRGWWCKKSGHHLRPQSGTAAFSKVM
ncbi:MAG: hypothetical protein QG661_2789 [Actinomycetota bacterium]|jgi:hypothetical protein|nr:hypothetical protein [Actinomycetota bacterium]